MAHVPELIYDLALMLCAAGGIILLFKRLNQPVVLGYIVAGFLVGPNMHLFPTISDIPTIQIWAEIGVIFLLFSLGLEFSFKKLMKVGSTSFITGIFEVSLMFVIGYFAGQCLGWGNMDSIFLGGIISISSTTIIIRAFDELGLKSKKFAGTVMGILVIEDLVAVLLLVLLSTLAVSRDFSGIEMIVTVVKLLFFLVLWFIAGIFLLPTFLKRTKKFLNDETMLIISLALCLLMVVLVSQAGFSMALGAFIMGSILAETTQAERIEHLVKPVKDLFGAVFFVSVGMLINPVVLVEYAGPVLLLTLAVILGKTINVSIGSLIAGQPLKQSVQAGMSLAQIGEFSFIIATLGLSLKVTSEFLYPIAVGVSAVTTFVTPYMMKLSEPFYRWLEKVLPQKWVSSLNRYSTGAQHINAENDWKTVFRAFLEIMALNSVVLVAIILLFSKVIEPIVVLTISERWGEMITGITAILCMSPFLWMLTIKRITKPAYTSLWLNKYNHGPIIALEIARVALAVFLIGFLLDQIFSTLTAFVAAIVIISVAVIIFSRRLQAFSARIEQRFITNLHDREKNQARKIDGDGLTPWDAHLVYFIVNPHSVLTGKTLLELAVREKYGVNIALIERGEQTILVPSRHARLFPGDRIAVIGTDEQLQQFRSVTETPLVANAEKTEEELDVSLNQITVSPGFPYLGQTIRESGIRERTNGLIVGIERNGERILNPDSTTRFELDDTLWIVGSSRLIKTLTAA